MTDAVATVGNGAGGFDAAAFASALLALAPNSARKNARRENARNAAEYAAFVASMPETIAARHAAIVARCAERTGDLQYAHACQRTAFKLDATLRKMRDTEDRESLIVRAFDRADLPVQVARDIADHLATWSARKVRAIAEARANLARTPGQAVACVETRARDERRAVIDVHVGPQSGRAKGAPKSGAPDYDRAFASDARARISRDNLTHRMVGNAPVKADAPMISYAARLAALRALRAQGGET